MPIIIIALLSILGGGTIAVSQNSLPGDALFPVKTATEDVRVFFAGGERENELRLEFAADRVKEISDIADSSNDSIDDKRLSGLDDAIDNLEDNLSGVADRARRDRNRGNSERALESLEDLKAHTGVLSEVMENQRQRSSMQEIRDKIELAMGKVDGVRVRVEIETEDIEGTEKSESGNAQSSTGKINAAENKLAEVERKFDRRKDGLLDDNKIEVEKKITESKSLIESAKSDSGSGKFDDAFEKAHQAIRTASLANALISRDDEIRIVSGRRVNQIIDDMGRRDRSFVSGVEIKTDPAVNNSTEAKVEVRFMTSSGDKNAVAQEILNRLKLDKTTIGNVLKISDEGLEELRERMEGRIESRDGMNEVRFEFRFPLSTRSRTSVIDGIDMRLKSLGLSTVSGALEVRIDDNARDRGQEQELRGGQNDDNGLRGDGTIDDNSSRNSGLDDNGLRGDGTVDDNLPRRSGLDDNGLRGDGSVDDNLPRNSGLDDNGLRGDGTVDDNLPRNSGLDDNGLRGDGSVDDNSTGGGSSSGGSSSGGSGSSGGGSNDD